MCGDRPIKLRTKKTLLFHKEETTYKAGRKTDAVKIHRKFVCARKSEKDAADPRTIWS